MLSQTIICMMDRFSYSTPLNFLWASVCCFVLLIFMLISNKTAILFSRLQLSRGPKRIYYITIAKTHSSKAHYWKSLEERKDEYNAAHAWMFSSKNTSSSSIVGKWELPLGLHCCSLELSSKKNSLAGRPEDGIAVGQRKQELSRSHKFGLLPKLWQVFSLGASSSGAIIMM